MRPAGPRPSARPPPGRRVRLAAASSSAGVPHGLTIAPPPAATITLVRHGQSTWNEAGRMQGSSDESVLTPRGRAQAAAARDAVRRGGGRGEADAS
jgi:probable phosphoglycerate mutase